MVKRNNKAVILLKRPAFGEVLLTGKHIALTTVEIDDELQEGEVLTRNLYLDVGPCK